MGRTAPAVVLLQVILNGGTPLASHSVGHSVAGSRHPDIHFHEGDNSRMLLGLSKWQREQSRSAPPGKDHL